MPPKARPAGDGAVQLRILRKESAALSAEVVVTSQQEALSHLSRSTAADSATPSIPLSEPKEETFGFDATTKVQGLSANICKCLSERLPMASTRSQITRMLRIFDEIAEQDNYIHGLIACPDHSFTEGQQILSRDVAWAIRQKALKEFAPPFTGCDANHLVELFWTPREKSETMTAFIDRILPKIQMMGEFWEKPIGARMLAQLMWASHYPNFLRQRTDASHLFDRDSTGFKNLNDVLKWYQLNNNLASCNADGGDSNQSTNSNRRRQNNRSKSRQGNGKHRKPNNLKPTQADRSDSQTTFNESDQKGDANSTDTNQKGKGKSKGFKAGKKRKRNGEQVNHGALTRSFSAQTSSKETSHCWLVDSGAQINVTHDKIVLEDYQKHKDVSIRVANGDSVHVESRGVLSTSAFRAYKEARYICSRSTSHTCSPTLPTHPRASRHLCTKLTD